MKSTNIDAETTLDTKRIEALSDGIFAIAMTLLVLTLDLPEAAETASKQGLAQLLRLQIHKFTNYVLSFVLLGIFWSVHHRHFHCIGRTDQRHLWINMFFLMFVALVPFTTTVNGDYPHDWLAAFLFAANMAAVGTMLSWDWRYATRGHRLVRSDLGPAYITLARRRGLVLPLISVLAMALAFIPGPWSSYVFLLIPVVLALPWFRASRSANSVG